MSGNVLSESNPKLETVALTVYLTDMAHFDANTRCVSEYCRPSCPRSTMIEVSALVLTQMLMEITAVAISNSG